MAESGNSPRLRRAVARAVFFAVVALFWLAALGIALELGAAAKLRRVENTNPLVLLKEDRKPDPAAAAPFVQARASASTEPREPIRGCGWLVAGATGVHLSDTARTAVKRPVADTLLPAPGQDRREAIAGFPGLSEAERATFALLHGETVYALDTQGKLLRAYGDYLRRRPRELLFWNWRGLVQRCTTERTAWHDLLRACREAQAGGPAFVPVPSVSDLGDPLVYAPQAQPGAGEAAFLFVRSLASEQKKRMEIPPGSPWKIAWFRYQPNLRGVQSWMGHPIDTNNHGFFDTDFAVPKPQGAFRILCIGGSTTEEGETVSATFPKLLEKGLRAAAPGAKVEVLNCGIAGMAGDGQLENLREYLSFEPDLVVLYEGVNDILKALPDYWFAWPDHWWRGLLRRSTFARVALPLSLLPPEETLRHDLRAGIIANLDAIRGVFAAKSIPIAVCTLPCPDPRALTPTEREYFGYDARKHWRQPWLTYPCYTKMIGLFNDELRRWCAGEDLCLIPVDRAYRDGYAVFNDLCHMNQAGIERKARAILSGLLGSAKDAFPG